MRTVPAPRPAKGAGLAVFSRSLGSPGPSGRWMERSMPARRAVPGIETRYPRARRAGGVEGHGGGRARRKARTPHAHPPPAMLRGHRSGRGSPAMAKMAILLTITAKAGKQSADEAL